MKKVMSQTASSSNSVTGTYLIDDILFEIFLRLPFDSIFKFRCVSKVWFSILSNPSFMNSWYNYKLNNLSLPWGFVNFADTMEDNNNFRRKFTIAYPDSYSHIVPHHNWFSLSFLNPIFANGNAENQTCLYMLGSSNGLVLCATSINGRGSYYVCNPLTKKWVSLPPPVLINVGWVTTGFTCNKCGLVSFKVIRVPEYKDAAKEFKVEIFSSDSGEWNVYNVSCPQYFTWVFSFADCRVIHNGIFYWMRKGCSHILAFSVTRNTNHGTCGNECKLIDLPDRGAIDDGVFKYTKRHYLGESEGSIWYVRIEDTERSLCVWVLEEERWYLVNKVIKFHDTLVEMVSRLLGGAATVGLVKEVKVLGFSPIDKNVLILGYKECIWAYNTKAKVYKRLCHPSFMSSDNFTPHLGWVTFALVLKPTRLPPVTW